MVGKLSDCCKGWEIDSAETHSSQSSVIINRDNLELTKIVFPKNLKKIWYGVFTDCKNLKEIEFAGTKEQWESITKISNWNYNCNSIKVTCKADNNTFDIPPYKY